MSDNSMRDIVLNKLVINIGTGADQQAQENAKRLLTLLTARKPCDEISRKRNPAFKITKGQKIGAFVTLRGMAATALVPKLLDAVDNRLRPSCITDNSVAFGIHEYIDISGVKYDPKIGMLGMNVNLSFKRRGLSVTQRKRKRSIVPRKHRIIPGQELSDYMSQRFKTQVATEA